SELVGPRCLSVDRRKGAPSSFLRSDLKVRARVVDPLGGGWEHAQDEPIHHRTDGRGRSYPGGSSPNIYVAVSGRVPSTDRAVCRTGTAQRRDRPATQHASGRRLGVAESLLRATISGASNGHAG